MERRKIRNDELGRLSNEAFKTAEKKPLVVVLDNVRSLNNVGSAFRTADAFLVEKIYLTGITGKPPHREIQKTALGATESVDWEYEEDVVLLCKRLKDDGYKLIAIEQVTGSNELNVYTPDTNEKYAVVFGNEVFGVNEEVVEIADSCIEIPQYGTKHSLNISVSIGIVLWDFFNKLKKTP